RASGPVRGAAGGAGRDRAREGRGPRRERRRHAALQLLRRVRGFVARRSRAWRVESGMNVVALGGGTGLPVVLTARRRNLPASGGVTAIVTAADDGGSSGVLR